MKITATITRNTISINGRAYDASKHVICGLREALVVIKGRKIRVNISDEPMGFSTEFRLVAKVRIAVLYQDTYHCFSAALPICESGVKGIFGKIPESLFVSLAEGA